MQARDLPRGALAPMVSTFDDAGELSLAPYRRQIEWLISEGIDGIVVAGSTGEGNTVDAGELARMVDCAIETAAGRVPVLASIIAQDTRTACLKGSAIRGKDLKAIQVVPPYYIFRPPDEGLVDFYARVADAADCPVLIYNCISWAGIKADLAARILAESPGVVGVKQSLRDMDALVAMTKAVGAERVYAAIDPALKDCFELGCPGAISALSTVAPRATSKLFHAVQAGDHELASRLDRCLAEFCRVLAGEDMPAIAKGLLEIEGIPVGPPRAPLRPLAAARRDAARKARDVLAEATAAILA